MYSQMSIEEGGIRIEQTEEQFNEAYVTVGVSEVRLTEAQLHKLYVKLGMFMTNINHQKQGWAWPY